jgi:hypothetical protein
LDYKLRSPPKSPVFVHSVEHFPTLMRLCALPIMEQKACVRLHMESSAHGVTLPEREPGPVFPVDTKATPITLTAPNTKVK